MPETRTVEDYITLRLKVAEHSEFEMTASRADVYRTLAAWAKVVMSGADCAAMDLAEKVE